MKQRLYVGAFKGGEAIISKVPVKTLTPKEAVKLKNHNEDNVVCFHGNWFKILTEYMLSDFEFISINTALIMLNINKDTPGKIINDFYSGKTFEIDSGVIL